MTSSNDQYTLEWGRDRPLGLWLEEGVRGVPVVSRITTCEDSQVHVGDWVVGINHQPIGHESFARFMNRLTTLPRPLWLTFQSMNKRNDTQHHLYAYAVVWEPNQTLGLTLDWDPDAHVIRIIKFHATTPNVNINTPLGLQQAVIGDMLFKISGQPTSARSYGENMALLHGLERPILLEFHHERRLAPVASRVPVTLPSAKHDAKNAVDFQRSFSWQLVMN